MDSFVKLSLSSVEEGFQENREEIEKGAEILGKLCEILAVTAGYFFPMLGPSFKVLAKLLYNPEDKEAKYLAEQFDQVNQKLKQVQDEMKQTVRALQRSSLNRMYFKSYEQIMAQYELFQRIFTAKPEYKKKKIENFITLFKQYEGDKNLVCLYDAITKEDTSGHAMLDTILVTEERSMKAVEKFCDCIKKVFEAGIMALVSYDALKEGGIDEDMVKEWQARMEDVEKRMKAAVDECVNNFAEQATTDIKKMLRERQSSVDPDFTKFLMKALAEKYDWVSWSVRVFKDDDSIFWKIFFGKRHHVSAGGGNYFEHLGNSKIKIVVSFTVDTKPLNKSQIKDQIEEVKGNVESMAESLCKSFPNCLVHVISCSNIVEEANNFIPDHFFFIFHNAAYICIHSK